MNLVWDAGRRFYIIAMYAFVLSPVFIVVFISLNKARVFPAAFSGITLHWYGAILEHPEFINAAETSAAVALLSSTTAIVFSFLVAYALTRYRPVGAAVIETALMSPLLVPQIVISLAILQFANLLGVGTNFVGLVAAHSVHVMPFALRLILTGMTRFSFSLEEASLSLGASQIRTWRHVTLPVLRPSLVAGFTFCFILSFVNLPVSLFLTTPHTATLPIVMFAYIESRIDAMIAAVASVTVLVAALLTLLLEQVLKVRIVD
jgi:putative spermidine/putrescine transport system permease protein